MKKEKRKIPCIFYLYIHSKIYDKIGGSKPIRVKEATNFLHEWRIPKFIRVAIMKELQILGLIEKKNRYLFEVKKPEIDLTPSNIYNLVGILSLKD
jgi:hypothetical protein